MKQLIKKPGQIIIPSDQAFLQEFDEYLEESLHDFGMKDDDIADVAISVTEVVNNAIVHGNKNNPEKIVEVKLKIKRGDLEVLVIDQGEGFNSSEIPDPLSEENILKETGRGIFIIRSLMDEVEISAGQSGGTVVRLVKKDVTVGK
jgi:serine/threonine-protein kinase RsbW